MVSTLTYFVPPSVDYSPLYDEVQRRVDEGELPRSVSLSGSMASSTITFRCDERDESALVEGLNVFADLRRTP